MPIRHIGRWFGIYVGYDYGRIDGWTITLGFDRLRQNGTEVIYRLFIRFEWVWPLQKVYSIRPGLDVAPFGAKAVRDSSAWTGLETDRPILKRRRWESLEPRLYIRGNSMHGTHTRQKQ